MTDIPLGSLCSEIRCSWFNCGYSRSCARNSHKFHTNTIDEIKRHERISDKKLKAFKLKCDLLRLSDNSKDKGMVNR